MSHFPSTKLRGLSRRWLLAVPLALAACAGDAPVRTSFPPLDFSYLTKLRLNVASVEIDDSWFAPPNAREVGAYAPIPPAAALHQMALDRLGAGGGSGRAVFTIVDASLLRGRGRIDGSLAVRLTATSGDGARSGYAEARVVRTLTLPDDDPATLRDALYKLVKQAMDDMNVEFEFQVRRSMRDWLQTTSDNAPPPPPVQSQDLPPPGAATGGATTGGAGPTPLAPPPDTPESHFNRPDPGMPRMSDPDDQD
jgi:hypothetical protein